MAARSSSRKKGGAGKGRKNESLDQEVGRIGLPHRLYSRRVLESSRGVKWFDAGVAAGPRFTGEGARYITLWGRQSTYGKVSPHYSPGGKFDRHRASTWP